MSQHQSELPPIPTSTVPPPPRPPPIPQRGYSPAVLPDMSRGAAVNIFQEECRPKK